MKRPVARFFRAWGNYLQQAPLLVNVNPGCLLMEREESPPAETLADVLREVIGLRTQYEVATAGGVSHTYLGHWIQGRVPQRAKLTEFAEGLFRKGWIDASQWRRLFQAAGYVAPPTPNPDHPSGRAVSGWAGRAAGDPVGGRAVSDPVGRAAGDVVDRLKPTGKVVQSLFESHEQPGRLTKAADAQPAPDPTEAVADAVIRKMREQGWAPVTERRRNVPSAQPVGDEPTGAEILGQGLIDLYQEFGRPIPVSFDEQERAKLTPDGARRKLAEFRRMLESGEL